jgi:competence protein ComGC
VEKKMKPSLKKQQGMTLISMACVAIVVVSMFLLALNIIPIYMDHGKVKGAMDSIKQNPDSKNETADQIHTRLSKVLRINNLDDLVTKDNITVTREDTGVTRINIKYEVVKKLVSNASILVEFDDTVDIR